MSAVKVRFLGSGDAFGSGGRLQTCIHLRSSAGQFLLDCGASSLVAMKRAGVHPGEVDAILITHLHGDHFGGIPFFPLDAQFSKRTKPLELAGPPGLRKRVRDAMEVFFPGSSRTPKRFPIRYSELADGRTCPVASLRVTPFRVIHASGAPPYALRVECEGNVVAYSGDTEWTDALLDAARGADLFICEAYHFDKIVKFHLDYQTLSRHRASLGCKRLIVTHMSSEMLSRLDELGVEFAEDGKEVLLSGTQDA